MIYLNTFKFSAEKLSNPNIYPHNVFASKNERCLIFDKITIFYGNNACGKSSLLNIIANKLNLTGMEEVIINSGARFLNNQYIIATHSPFMLGTLNAKIYNLDLKDFNVCSWSELENVKYFYDFFKKHKNEFED